VLRVVGSAADRVLFEKRAGDNLEFNAFIPYPEEFKAMDDAAKKWKAVNVIENDGKKKLREGARWEDQPKDGFNSGGYEWRLKNWGTKWPAKVNRKFEKDGTTIYCHDTAWGPAIPVFRKMAREFPSLTFVLSFDVENYGHERAWMVLRGDTRCYVEFECPFHIPPPDDVQTLIRPDLWSDYWLREVDWLPKSGGNGSEACDASEAGESMAQ
jgi:hypothetical protein